MDYREIIKSTFADDKNISAVVLYGSMVHDDVVGTFREDSDIDLAFLPIDNNFDKMATYKRLREINRDIDIVNLKKINPTLGMQIIKDQEILLMKDLNAWDAWKTQTLTQYHDLQISNRNIIKDLGKYSPLQF